MKYNITYIIPIWGRGYLPSQYEFLRENYGGTFVYLDEEGQGLKNEVGKLLVKGKVNIAFWADTLTFNIHRLFRELGIKQIFIEHGCCPKKWFTHPPNTEARLRNLSNFSQLWPTSKMEEDEYKRGGRVLEKKIKKIGYLKALQYFNDPKKVKSNKNQIYLCPSYWADWGEMVLAIKIIKNIPEKYKCYVSLHPSAYEHYYDEMKKRFKENKNIIIMENNDEKIERLRTSEIVIGGNATPLTEALYMKKKVILIKGENISWERIKLLEISGYQFANVIDDAVKLSHINGLKEALKKAKYPRSAGKIFYKSNFSKEETLNKINKSFQELAGE